MQPRWLIYLAVQISFVLSSGYSLNLQPVCDMKTLTFKVNVLHTGVQ